jgi:methyl-accepting chemotaxis protein
MTLALPANFNLRIGGKLIAMSTIGVLLVAAMMVMQFFGNAAIESAGDRAILQSLLARNVIDAKASIRGMQTGVGDMRLALSPEDIERAVKYVEARRNSAAKFIAASLKLVTVPENIDRLNAVEALIDQYHTGAKELAAIRARIVDIRSSSLVNGVVEAEAAKQIDALNEQAIKFARERTLPLAAKMEEGVNAIAAIATKRSDEAAEETHHDIRIVNRAGLAIGLFVVFMMLASALFGAVFIARPLRRMAAVLVELTHDRIVDVPFTGRRDEIGDIARATDVFKDSIAEKVTNLRVRLALDIAQANVMLADENYNIIYMNSTIGQMFRETEPELRKALPQFDSNKLQGANMDVFHRNPAHQRAILDKLSASHSTNLAVGTLKFSLTATPVTGKNGKRIGTVVEWKNETAEKAIEAEVSEIVAKASAGDFGARVAVDGKKGFMLNLGKSINSLCETTATVLNDLVTMLGALSHGDLTKRVDADYQGTFGRLKDDANAMAEKLTSIVSQIKAGTDEVAGAASEISAGTTDLSQRTEEQAASLEQTSASMEQISATVKKNAESAQQANQSAASTREVASRGGEVVAQAVEAMSRIEDSSRKIADIISVIDEIARQTNLLALNAAVEAARAGDAGRGFAVVAAEVRSLAQRSSQAAKDIKDLINSSTSEVKDGVDLVNRTGVQLKEIVQSIAGVATLVSEIADASTEQASGIDQVNKALAQMDEVTQQNSALVEQNAAAAKTLEQQAATINGHVGFFKVGENGPAAAPAPRRRESLAPSRKANGRGPVGRIQSALAVALQDEPGFKEF